ncbi:hypothetical protein [Kribbella sp. CA-293567]|uniref:hypothetical protein n=1 Tax=Kribbella sp. CA-293567 TaxID=3002436 RepID=UPI0022DE4C0A|nr:hypothetical protein [Kribbella sp. CA-293567]WBQ02946.1 hypothetical protein OX958_23535 [Kribbella sp. CA-293567]
MTDQKPTAAKPETKPQPKLADLTDQELEDRYVRVSFRPAGKDGPGEVSPEMKRLKAEITRRRTAQKD